MRINRATENDKFLNRDHHQVIGLHIAAGELGIALVKQLARRKYFGAAPDIRHPCRVVGSKTIAASKGFSTNFAMVFGEWISANTIRVLGKKKAADLD